MLENETIARPYAQAAFSEAREHNRLSEWSEALAFLAAVVSDPLMRRTIQDPRIAKPRLAQLVLEIGSERLSGEIQNFVKVLVHNGRLQFAPAVSRLFEVLRADAEGTVDIEVISAFELKREDLQRITQAVKKRLNKNVAVNTRTDRNLIGGVVIRVGDLVIDASLRGRLHQLQSEFI